MADKTVTVRQAKLNSHYVDNDTRMLTFDDPKANLSKTDIKTLEAYMVTNQPLLGDKGGAAFNRFDSAHVIEKTVVTLDLG